MFHHKSIKRFGIEGTLYDEAHIERLKIEYTALLVLQMKSEGYVVRADIDPDFTIFYNGTRGGYSFKLSIYGVYLGKKRAQEVDRMYGYKPQYAKKPIEDKQKKTTGTT